MAFVLQMNSSWVAFLLVLHAVFGAGGVNLYTLVYASVFAAYLDPHRILRNVIFYNAFVFHFTIYITAFAGHT